ncbi:DUF4935 domain-containing protein [Chryseobacterium sp. PCH239]|uniref:PIN domain-containing protein n=1 Tax=Chryseobacterium sp. PCH239 TaxID=2825845 RepID=UPI001C113D45|nr:PIN domain-containing protein [Chryseobacterium sp. PCH239]QWT87126.1 DUF4935 domain-containing protein [Chryseobacterium sp. PCH239]
MELQSRNLIIDTQYFVSIKLDFNNKTLQKLKKLVDDNSVKIYLTDITIAEVNKKIEEKIQGAIDKISVSEVQYLKTVPAFNKFIEEYSYSRAVEEVKKNFDLFLESYRVVTIPSDKVNVLDIFNMYLEIRAPFSTSKKKEFPDAFVLESIKHWCKKNNNSAYLLSKDPDWKNYISNYNHHLKNNVPLLILQEDLVSLIDTVIRKDNELKDQVAFADKKIERNWEVINKEILEKFNDIEFDSYGFDGEEITDVFLIDCKLLQKDILEAKQESSSYELLLEFDFIVKYFVTSYDNIYFDTVDELEYNLEYSTVYRRYTTEQYMTIDFSFPGGLDTSFKIDEITLSKEIITLDYEDGKFIDIKEWCKNLPVIVCGVKDGIITEDGLGVMNFKDLDEAQKIFPQLSIKTETQDFTSALGNKINENLRFETWKALELYSS